MALSIFPPLALAVSNRNENISLADVLPSLGICLWLVALAWVASKFATLDPHRRGLITLAVVVWFLGYGRLAGTLNATQPVSALAEDDFLLPGTVLLVALACWRILRYRKDLAGASRFLNLMSLFLLLFLPITYVSPSPDPRPSWKPTPLPEAGTLATPSAQPDIYYIVLDAYNGRTSLAQTYGFDNDTFETKLRARGFYVPKHGRANYASTFLALAAALNWEYLDWIPQVLGAGSRDRSIPYHMIENNRTMRFLKRMGYRIVFFPTAYRATSQSPHADQLIPSNAAGQPAVRGEFLPVWLGTTALRPLLQLGCRFRLCDQMPFRPEPPELILWKFARLAELPALSRGSTFVLAHLMVPHEPYVFKSDCSPKPLSWEAATDPDTDSARVAYVEQVQCVNRLILQLVDHLIHDSSRPPVIILQADHGNARFPFGRPPSLDDISDEQLKERTDVFAAYYGPRASTEFYDSITPINVIPAVFRAYFGASIPRLEDRSYYSSWREPYRFTRVH